MDRRSFMKLSPAFPAGAVSAALVLRTEGQEDISLDVSVLKTQPGDLVILTAPGHVNHEMALRIQKCFESGCPGLKAVLLGDGLKIAGVIRP